MKTDIVRLKDVVNTSLFNPNIIRQIKDIQKVFPGSKLIIYYATAEQIEQLKSEGLCGVSKKQRK